jgi:thiazole synthase
VWDEPLVLSSRTFRSRLVIGVDGYPSPDSLRRSHEASGAELVVLRVRGLDLGEAKSPVLEWAEQGRVTVLASTSGCQTGDEALRTAYLAREAGLGEFVLLDVVGDTRTEMPDLAAILEAGATLVREGFAVLPVTGADPVVARRLQDAGVAAVVAQAAPAGSGLGVRNRYLLRLLLETVTVPVVLGGGIGTASDAALAMELGCHAVLVGTAIAEARDPETMAEAMRHAVEAGRAAYRAGRVPRRLHRYAFGSPD